MKKWVWILLLSSAARGFGQQIGVSLGTSLFDPSAVINMEEASPAKNVCGHLAIRLSDDVKLSLAAGFGYETTTVRIDYQNPGEAYQRKSRLTGMPLECEIQVSKPFVILSGIRPFIGLGLGYYDYRTTGDIRSSGTLMNFENRIRGLAQYFSFGLEYSLRRSISAFLQMKKMGFSGIEATGDYPPGLVPGGKFKESMKSGSGLNDLALTLGILFHLRPGEESSILEKLR